MEPRPLSISDFQLDTSADLRNPYAIFGLNTDATFHDVRAAYIRLSKIYHPALVNPSFNPKTIHLHYSEADLSRAAIPHSLEQLVDIWNQGSTSPPNREQLIKWVQVMANQKMVLLNCAYGSIKKHTPPKELTILAGFDRKTIFNKQEGFANDIISLEGRGEITLFPNDYEGHVSGAYLSFDHGPALEDPWRLDEWGYRHSMPIKHIFAHIEYTNRRSITPALLTPLFESHELSSWQQAGMLEFLSEGGSDLKEAFAKLELAVSYSLTDQTQSLRRRNFERQMSHVLRLNYDPLVRGDFEFNHDFEITYGYDDSQLILNDYGESKFTEADLVLLTTLAYGNLLK